MKSKIKLPKSTFSFLRNALQGVVDNGTARGVFAGWPQRSLPIAGKTGTGQASGNKDDTAWFASFAPANKPKYAVVVMVSQGGLGGSASAPAVRQIYQALFGVIGQSIDSKNSVLVTGVPAKDLPTINSDGSVTPLPAVKAADAILRQRYGIGG